MRRHLGSEEKVNLNHQNFLHNLVSIRYHGPPRTRNMHGSACDESCVRHPTCNKSNRSALTCLEPNSCPHHNYTLIYHYYYYHYYYDYY